MGNMATLDKSKGFGSEGKIPLTRNCKTRTGPSLLHPLKTSHIYCKFQNICWKWYIFLLRSGTKVKEVLSVNKPIEEDSEDDLKDNMWLEMRRINN